MKQRTNVVLLATLLTATAGAQDVSVYGTTMAQMTKQDGFDKNTFAPATQFLGIDATGLGTEALSLHLFGWGRVDLADQSQVDGKSGGDLTFGYVKYRFAEANAELKAGRFGIYQGAGFEQVDGVSGRADLKHGFTVSFFAGKPVIYDGGLTGAARADYRFQRDFVFGGRLGMRISKFGELGVAYLQDGTSPAMRLPIPSANDYTRRHLSADLRFVPVAVLDFSGRTVWDVAPHPVTLNVATPSRIAEHDYTAALKLAPGFVLTGNFLERNYNAYYAGTNMPSLFRQRETGKFRGYGGSLMIGPAEGLQLTADLRTTKRHELGETNRIGGDVRWSGFDSKAQSGLALHRIKAFNVKRLDRLTPTYGLSHWESRFWAMFESGRYSFSLDSIRQSFDDTTNPNLNGEKVAFEVVGSVGARITPNVKVSGDLSYGTNPMFQKEVRGLLRAEYRFAMARKGGK